MNHFMTQKMKNKKIIPLSVPNISGNEWKYVKDCLDTGWISSIGSYVNEFEKSIAKYCNVKYAIATSSGTTALHTSLQILGVKENDYVIIPNITFVATANAVKYCGAEPILIDVDPNTWQFDLDLVEDFIENSCETNYKNELFYKKDKRKISAIIPVHVQGNMCDMNRLVSLSRKYSINILEDAAEALGSSFKKKSAGTFGILGCLSFNGNKTISTGGGGMILTNNQDLASRAKHLTTTAKKDPMEYYHDEVGYNYRLVNVLAAIGVAQLEQLPEFLKRKDFIGKFYTDNLSNVGDISFQKVNKDVITNHWLFTIKTKFQKKLLKFLNENGIISRPFWMPMNKLPMYKNCIYINNSDNCKIIHENCISIPSSTNITDEELSVVVNFIKKFFNEL